MAEKLGKWEDEYLLITVFDTETTGFTAADRILEIGLIQMNERGEVVCQYETLINPMRDIANSHVHGITPQMVFDAPEFKDVAKSIAEIMAGSDLVAAYNLPFDQQMLSREFARIGYEMPEFPPLCVMQFIRSLYPDGPRKLIDVCRYHGISVRPDHSALTDSLAAAGLLRKHLEKVMSMTVPPRTAWDLDFFLPPSPFKKRSDGQRTVQVATPILARLSTALGATDAGGRLEPYFELLDQVFADSILEDWEAEELVSLAKELGLSVDEAHRAHQSYIDGIYALAMKDSFLSEMESRHLEVISQALGVVPSIDADRRALISLYPRDLAGKAVCFTGAPMGRLDGRELSRKEMTELATNAGIDVKSSVTRDLDFLVARDTYSMSGKAQKARETGVPVVSEQVFWNWLGVQVSTEEEGAIPRSTLADDGPVPATTEELEFDIVRSGTLNYAAYLNSVPLISHLSLVNRGRSDLRDLKLTITLEPDVMVEPWTRTLARLGPNQRFEPSSIDLALSAEKLRRFDERERGYLKIELHSNDECLASKNLPLEVLAFNEWGGGAVAPQLLAAFCLPNHPALAEFQSRASSWMKEWSGNGSLDGYQSRSKSRVREMAAAFYAAVKESGLQYINPPASFENTGQKVRTVDQIVQQGRATCLDITLLFCALLESAGLRPVAVLVKGHAFPGVWLDEFGFSHTVVDEPLDVQKQVEVGRLCLFDSSPVTHPLSDFERAEESAKRALAESFEYAVDVRLAREERILPLSSRYRQEEEASGLQGASVPSANRPKELDDTLEGASNGSGPVSVAQKRINRWREKLLDLTLRNRLLNFKPLKKTLCLQQTALPELEDMLAAGKKFRISSRLQLDKERDAALHLERTGEDLLAEKLLSQMRGGGLNLLHTEEETEKRLVTIYREARTIQEETGSNTLYLALGFLEWFETKTSEEPRLAPILLVPCTLERKSNGRFFELTTGEEDTQINVTLLEKLRQDFGIDITGLDELPEDHSGLHVEAIFRRFRERIIDIPRWRVVEEASVGFFSFTKFLMWQDLQAQTPEDMTNPVLSRLLGEWDESKDERERSFLSPEELDSARTVDTCLCPLDADSSQLSAIFSAEEGKSFVLQGPPGTGKSQTITNLIAQTLSVGKRVLFVAEKRAALEVVFKRLESVGLGAFCLELHSKKARKSDVLEQLRRPLELARETEPQGWEQLVNRLQAARDGLNEYAGALHKPQPLGISFFEGISQLCALGETPTFRYSLDSSQKLNSDGFEALLESAREVALTAREVGNPGPSHPLFGIAMSDYSPKKAEVLKDCLDEMRASRNKVLESLEEVSSRLKIEADSWSGSDLTRLRDFCHEFWHGPECPALLLGGSWNDKAAQVKDWMALVGEAVELRSDLEQRWDVDRLLKTDLDLLVTKFEQHQDSNAFISFFTLWGARRALKSAKQTKEKIAVECLKSAVRLRTLLKEIGDVQSQAQATLGRVWLGEQTEEKVVHDLLNWVEAHRKELYWLEETTGTLGLKDSLAQVRPSVQERWPTPFCIEENWPKFMESLERVHQAAELDANWFRDLLENSDLLSRLLGAVDGWSSHLSGLREWSHYVRASQKTRGLSLQGLIEHLESDLCTADQCETVVKASVLKSWVNELLEETQVLRQFQGTSHDQLVEQFQADDKESMKLLQKVIRARLAARVPVRGDSTSPSSELGILTRELHKKRGHLPCRVLFSKLPTLLPVLKPCVLMSPLSVSQYLNANSAPFDVVVFDEASQITVWDAIGSLMRAEQAVVVGDSKQLPPTSFFSTQDSEDEQDSEVAQDLESILDECRASGMPEHSLRWHYRSRHESLITFSNRRYYDSKLLTFPSAYSDHPRLGLHFRKVNGVYDRGATRTNRAEAEAIVRSIVERLLDPELQGQSLGVVTFNTQQQTLIEDLLDQARVKMPQIEPFFTEAVAEPVFVKNLENVQGDERDVIFFSITYGPDEAGKVSMNFGPINKAGGERRLNVAVTRARERLEVYCSLNPTDIDLNRTKQEGTKHLRSFLAFAEQGVNALMNEAESNFLAEYESVLEEEIGKALEERGWELHRQVGCLGYRLDLGVVHPTIDGVYLAGVECDGATYHSSRCARDRDRIRQAVLESLGWTIHRVWSSDWWHNRTREIEKLDKKLKATLAGFDSTGAIPFSVTNLPKSDHSENGADSVELDALFKPEPSGENLPSMEGYAIPGTTRYKVADLSGHFSSNPDDFYDAMRTGAVRAALQDCLAVEAPISITELTRRVGERFGISRATKRANGRTVGILRSMPGVACHGDFVWLDEPGEYSEVRLPIDEYRREPGDIPLEEIANGASLILKQNVALPLEDLARETARLFGFKQLGSKVKKTMIQGVMRLEELGRCEVEGDQVKCLAAVR